MNGEPLLRSSAPIALASACTVGSIASGGATTGSSSTSQARAVHRPSGCCSGSSISKRCVPKHCTRSTPACSASTSCSCASTPVDSSSTGVVGLRAHLRALAQAHHAERLLLAQAAAHQVEVARLEHAQAAIARPGTARFAAGTAPGAGRLCGSSRRCSGMGSFNRLRPVRGAAPARRRSRRSAGPAARRCTPSGAGRRCSRSPP